MFTFQIIYEDGQKKKCHYWATRCTGAVGVCFGMLVTVTHGAILQMRNCCPQTFSLPFTPDELY